MFFFLLVRQILHLSFDPSNVSHEKTMGLTTTMKRISSISGNDGLFNCKNLGLETFDHFSVKKILGKKKRRPEKAEAYKIDRGPKTLWI